MQPPASTAPRRPRPKPSQSDRRRGRAVWITGVATLLVVLTLGALNRPAVERLSFLVFDAYQRFLPRQQADAPLVVVDIDEASIAALGQWPWPRTTIAELVERLGQLGAVTIAFDIVFPDPDRNSLASMAGQLRRAGAEVTEPAGDHGFDNDAVLADALARHSVTVGIAISNETEGLLPAPKAGFSFGGADPKTYLPPFRGAVVNLPELSAAATGMGSFSFPPSPDGIVRTIPLVALAQGNLYPALGVEALRVAQGAGSYIIRSTGASGEADTGKPAMIALRAGALDVPTSALGEFWVYFSGLPNLVTVSASEVLDTSRDVSLTERIGGRIVLIGTSAVGLRDLVATPMGVSTAGVYVHAEIIDQIVGQVFLNRPDWAPGAELVTAALLGLCLLFIAQRGGAVFSSTAAVVLVAAALAISWTAFAAARLLLDPLLPAIAVALVFGVTMPLLLRLTDSERRFVRGAFGRYLSPTLVERLAENPKALALGGENRELTVLFCDIRGFTSISENLDPQQLTSLLNGFLTPMTDVLLQSEATIDKYMGDAIMAFWNAPLTIDNHERKACLAALEMLAALERLNAGREKPIRIGVGLNSSICCVGNLGSAQRFSYSAIGDGVNLASRVEGLTKAYGLAILVTQATRAAAGDDLAFLEVDLVRVVGRAEPVAIFTLLGDAAFAASDGFKALASDHARLIAAYRSGNPAEAEAALAVAEGHVEPRLAPLYALYRERIADLSENPAPPGWDGVFTARQK